MKKKLFLLIITSVLLLTACSDKSPDTVENITSTSAKTSAMTTAEPIIKPWYEEITADNLSLKKEFELKGKATLLCSDGKLALYQNETELAILDLSTLEMVSVPSKHYFSDAKIFESVIAAKCSEEKKAVLLDKTTLKELSTVTLDAYEDFAIVDENTAYALDSEGIKLISGLYTEKPVVTAEVVADDYLYAFLNFEKYITHYTLEFSGQACFLKGINDNGEVAEVFVRDRSLGFTYSLDNKAFSNSDEKRSGEFLVSDGILYFADYRFPKYIPPFIECYDLNDWAYKTEASFCSANERVKSIESRIITLESRSGSTVVRRYEKDGTLCAEVSVPISSDCILTPLCDGKSEKLTVNSDGKLYVLDWDYLSGEVADEREDKASIYNLGGVNEKLAKDIKSQYGLNIFYGEEAVGSFSDYNTALCDNERSIFTSLVILKDNVLAKFPKDFFTRMLDGVEVTSYDVYLSGTISSSNEYNLSYASGVTNVEGNRQIMLVDIQFPDYTFTIPTENSLSTTLAHEIWHTIEAYVNRIPFLNPQMDYYDLPSLDYWYALNPSEFFYTFEYNQYFNDNSSYTLYAEDASQDNTYFIDTYAKVNPLEDKARLFETIFSGIRIKEGAFESKALMEKARYLCAVIREVYEIPDSTELCWESLVGDVEKYSYYENLQKENFNTVVAVG